MEKIKFKKDTKLLEKTKSHTLRKINIVKTFRISKLIYNPSVLAVPENFIKKIDKLIFSFRFGIENLLKKSQPSLVSENMAVSK